MKCEICEKEGLKSQIHIGGSVSTVMGYHQYYDEDGKHHSHDPNIRTTQYSCSNGHSFARQESGSCWCGWNK